MKDVGKIINKNVRIPYLDLLKVIAAFLMVFYHFAYYRLDYGFLEGAKYIPNFNRILMCFASCCVPLFFMVNGTLMLGRERTWKSVYLKAGKILLLVIVWSFADFPSWFFKTLIVLYILYPIFQYCFREKRNFYCGICILIFVFPFLYNFCIFVIESIGIVSVGPILVKNLQTTGVFTMYGILYFLLGPILEEKRLSLIKGTICMILGWGIVVTECTVYTNLNAIMYDGVNAAFPTLGALLLTVGCYSMVQYLQLQKIAKFLEWMGSSSLSIYLMHMIIIKCINFIYNSYHLNTGTALFCSVMICLICTILGKGIAKIPKVCWLMKI